MGAVVQPVRRSQVVVKVVSLVVVGVIVAAAGYVLSRDEPKRAKVGDCLAGATAEEIEIVECGDAKASFRIVGKIDKITQADWDSRENACEAYPTAESSYWEGEEGAVGYALCLEPVTK